MRCHKKIDATTKCLVENFEEEGIPTKKVATIFNTCDSSFFNSWNHIGNLHIRNLQRNHISLSSCFQLLRMQIG